MRFEVSQGLGREVAPVVAADSGPSLFPQLNRANMSAEQDKWRHACLEKQTPTLRQYRKLAPCGQFVAPYWPPSSPAAVELGGMMLAQLGEA
jgi:hypothetical protein